MFRVGVGLLVAFLTVTSLTGCLGSSNEQVQSKPIDQSEARGAPALKSIQSELEFEKEFKAYLRAAVEESAQRSRLEPTQQDMVLESAVAQDSASRVSETNRVEQGVDEADLIKANAEHLYVVNQGQYGYSNFVDTCESEVCIAEGVRRYSEKISPPHVRIMALDNITPQANELAKIVVDKVARIAGIYLVDNDEVLVVVGEGHRLRNDIQGFLGTTYVAAYDVADAAFPQLLWQFEVEGYLKASRSLNNKLYLISMHGFRIKGLNLDNPSDTVRENNIKLIDEVVVDDIFPRSWLNGTEFSAVEARDCLSPRRLNSRSLFDARLLSVLTIPLARPEDMQALCTLDSSGEVYVSPQAIYFTKGEYNVKQDGSNSLYSTVIHKLVFTDDGVAYRASGRIPGTTGWRSRAFRMSERDGYLRVVSTDYTRFGSEDGPAAISLVNFPSQIKHHLFVLSEHPEKPGELYQVASLPNREQDKIIGKPGEDIYAVRYVGDYAYVVTFRNIDPLYVINLKDPAAPFIEGELEIPGYSDYLHPLGNELLLGVGKEVVLHEGVALMQGVKVGLFDISDKNAPQLVSDKVFGLRGSDTALSYDYHAFSVLSDEKTGNHRIAIPMRIHDRRDEGSAYWDANWSWYLWSRSGVQLFDVNDGSTGVDVSMSHSGELVSEAYNEGDERYYYQKNPRTVIVDDVLHYVSRGKVWSALWEQPGTAVGPQ